jgi:hypothetical protein
MCLERQVYIEVVVCGSTRDASEPEGGQGLTK